MDRTGGQPASRQVDPMEALLGVSGAPPAPHYAESIRSAENSTRSIESAGFFLVANLRRDLIHILQIVAQPLSVHGQV